MEIIQQCPSCNSQGEITMSTERLILESKLIKELNGIIKKLNGEIDILQAKLEEKEGVKNEKSNVGSTREGILT